MERRGLRLVQFNGQFAVLERGEPRETRYRYCAVEAGMDESFEREQEGRTLTGDDIDRIANEYFDAAHKKISVETVQKVVEDFYRVSHNDLIGPGPEIIIQDAETPHSDLIQLIVASISLENVKFVIVDFPCAKDAQIIAR